MNAPTKLVLIAFVSLLIPIGTFAATTDVMVVVNGNTEVNRESYNFIRKTFRFNNINYSVNATMNPSTVKPGQYQTVVVLNTGTSSGLDPVLRKFIEGYTDKQNLYLVNLFRSQSRGDFTVTTFTADQVPEGIDGVTAASTWSKGGGGSSAEERHLEWVKSLVKFLGRS